MTIESKELNKRAQDFMGAEQWSEAIKLIESKPALFEKDRAVGKMTYELAQRRH